jgi:hypothetical protein
VPQDSLQNRKRQRNRQKRTSGNDQESRLLTLLLNSEEHQGFVSSCWLHSRFVLCPNSCTIMTICIGLFFHTNSHIVCVCRGMFTVTFSCSWRPLFLSCIVYCPDICWEHSAQLWPSEIILISYCMFWIYLTLSSIAANMLHLIMG